MKERYDPYTNPAPHAMSPNKTDHCVPKDELEPPYEFVAGTEREYRNEQQRRLNQLDQEARDEPALFRPLGDPSERKRDQPAKDEPTLLPCPFCGSERVRDAE